MSLPDHLPASSTARRSASVMALAAGCAFAAPALTACSNEGPLAPQPSTAVAPANPNTTGFVVGWGYTNPGAPGGTTGTTAPAGTGGTGVSDSTVTVPAPATRDRR